MATEGWRQATLETVISAAVILASDVVLQHLDGRLNIETDKAAVKKALHWAASRPGRLVTSAVNKASSGSTMGIPRSLTLESEVRSLLKAHGLSSAGEMPKFPGMHKIHKSRHTFDIMLGNAEKVTVRLSLPQTSQGSPTSFWTYIQDAINSMKILVCDKMMSMYTVLIDLGEYGYCMLSQRILNAGLVEQVLIGSVMAIGVVVGGTYLVRAIRPLDSVINEPEAIIPAKGEENHEARLVADEDQENESGNEQDWQNATGGESGVGGIDEKVVGEDEQAQSLLELKYMEAIRCLMEKSSAIEALESEAEQVEVKYTEALQCLMEKSSAVEALKSEAKQQKELLVTKDRQLEELTLTQGLLDTKEDTIHALKSEASTAKKLLGDRDQEIVRLNKTNTTLELTADQQRKAITSLTTRAEERTKTMKNLTKSLAEEQTETKQLRMDIANLRLDNNLMRSKNSALEADSTKPLKLIAELDTSNKELRKQITSLTEDYQDLQTQVDDDVVAFDSKLDDVVKLTTDKETLKAEIERLVKINEQFTELETTNGELTDEILSLVDDNQVLQTQVDDAEKELDDIDQSTTDKKSLNAEIERLSKINEQLTEAKDEFAVSAVDSQKTIDTLRTDNQKLEKQTDALETKNKHLKKTLNDAQENIKNLQDKVAALEDEVAEGKDERQGLLDKCDEGDAELKVKDNQMQQLKSALRDNGKLSSEKDGRISELEKAYKHMKSVNEESDDAYHDLEEEVDDLTEARDSAQAQLNSTQSELEQANIDLNSIRADLEASRKGNKALEATFKGHGKEPKSGDEEEGETDKEGREVDGGEGDRNEAHEEEDEEDGSDDEDEDAHDDQGPNNGSNETSRGEDNNDHEEDHEGDNDDAGEDDHQGDDAPDGGAGKTGQCGDGNQATEQSATPTTTQEAPQQPVTADGLSDTIRSPSVYPHQAGPANGPGGDDNRVTEQSATPTTTHGAPQHPLRADGLSGTIRSPSVYPLQAGPANNGIPETPPAVAAPPSPLFQQPQVSSPGPVPFTSEAPVKEGRVILPIRRRKNASDREGSQKNPFAGMTLPGMTPNVEPDVDGSTTTSPAQSLSAQDVAPQDPKQALNDDTATSVSPSHTIYPASGTSFVESTGPILPSPTQDQAPAPASSPTHPSHNPSAAEDKALQPKPEEESKQQRLGSDELIESQRSSPTPSASEGQKASTDVTQHDGPTSDLIDRIQSSSTPAALEEHAATTDSPSHGSPENGSDKPIQSPTTSTIAEQQAPRTDSGYQVASADESIDPVQSSPVPSTSGEQAFTADAAIQSSPTHEPNKPTQSSPTPSTAIVEPAAGNGSELQGASTDELIGPSQSSSNTPLDSYNCPPSNTTQTPAPSYDIPSPSLSPDSSHDNARPRSHSISNLSPTSPSTPRTPSENLNIATAASTPQVGPTTPHTSLKLIAYHSMEILFAPSLVPHLPRLAQNLLAFPRPRAKPHPGCEASLSI